MNSFRPHAVRKLTAQASDWSYDANGNVTNYTPVLGGGSKGLTWDAENRLSRVTIGGVLVDTIAYGPDGERLSKFQGTAAAPTSIAWFLGGDVEIGNIGGALTFTQYLHADVMREAGTVKYLHKDHLASNRIISNGSGNQLQKLTYAPYGKPTATVAGAGQPAKAWINERFGEAE